MTRTDIADSDDIKNTVKHRQVVQSNVPAQSPWVVLVFPLSATFWPASPFPCPWRVSTKKRARNHKRRNDWKISLKLLKRERKFISFLKAQVKFDRLSLSLNPIILKLTKINMNWIVFKSTKKFDLHTPVPIFPFLVTQLLSRPKQNQRKKRQKIYIHIYRYMSFINDGIFIAKIQ